MSKEALQGVQTQQIPHKLSRGKMSLLSPAEMSDIE